MTEGSKLGHTLIADAQKLVRHSEDLERALNHTASDFASIGEKIEQATARFGDKIQAAYKDYINEITGYIGHHANATNMHLMQTGIIPPPDDVHKIAEKCKPDLSRIESRKDK